MIEQNIFDNDIITAKKCPYCGGKPVFVDSSNVHKKSYGMIYLCRPCNSWVGVHKASARALGRLANKELRKYKKIAHHHFDKIWRKKAYLGEDKYKARRNTYKWLSEQLNIPKEYTHIGMFNIELCKQTIQICKNGNK